jgi:fimbrial chaperone protein
MRTSKLLALLFALHAGFSLAAEIGVTPVAVHLDTLNDRATVSVVNSGSDAVIMQVEAIEWKAGQGSDADLPTADLVINPSVFTVQPGQSQLVRVGLRRAAQADRESTYRIVLREVPAMPRSGDLRIGGQVRVLMALRLPIYVAPTSAVRASRWQATQAYDGSITAVVKNEGNVHVRIGKILLRSTEGAAVGDEAGAAVVLAGDSQKFQLRGATADRRPLTLDILTDSGLQSVAVLTALR